MKHKLTHAAVFLAACVIAMSMLLLVTRPRAEILAIGDEYASGDVLWADAVSSYLAREDEIPDSAQIVGPYFVWDVSNDDWWEDELDDPPEIAGLEAVSSVYQVLDGDQVLTAIHINRDENGICRVNPVRRTMPDAAELTGEFAILTDLYYDHIIVSERGIYRDESTFRYPKTGGYIDGREPAVTYYESPFDYLEIARLYGKKMLSEAREKYPLKRYLLSELQSLADTLVFRTEHAPFSLAMNNDTVKPVLRGAILEKAAKLGFTFKDWRTILGPYPVYKYEFRDGAHVMRAVGAMYHYSPGMEDSFFVDLALADGELKMSDFSSIRADDGTFPVMFNEKYYMYADKGDEFWFGVASQNNGIYMYTHDNNPLVRTSCSILTE